MKTKSNTQIAKRSTQSAKFQFEWSESVMAQTPKKLSTIFKSFYMIIINGTLVRHTLKNHFLYKYKAYGFDVSRMESLLGEWYTLAIITPTGRKYTISKADFYKYAKVSTEFGKAQYILPVKFLTLIKKTSTKSVVISEETHQKIKNSAKRKGITISEELERKYSLFEP